MGFLWYDPALCYNGGSDPNLTLQKEMYHEQSTTKQASPYRL
jgi:hypothetical protein